MSNSNRTPERAAAFCAALAETCNVGKACEAIGIGRTTAYEWRDADETFAQMWDAALKVGVSVLEDEATRRGHDGVDEPVFHQGQQCGTIRKYSDTLLIFLLKAHNPEKYRENSKVEIAGHLAVSEMTDDEIRAELANLASGLLVLEAPESGE